MKFYTEYTKSLEQKKLIYYVDEQSFDTEPSLGKVDFCIVINMINLTVIKGNVVEIWGFCPSETWITSEYEVSKYTKGILKVKDDVEPGFSYRLDKKWPVYFNPKTDWLCIGNPEISNTAIEFIPNCVAVIDQETLKALWLKPEYI